MPKMTKSQAKKRCAEIVTKMSKLFNAEYASVKDYAEVRSVIQRIRNRVK